MPPIRRISVCVRVKPALEDNVDVSSTDQGHILGINDNNIRLIDHNKEFECTYDKIFDVSSSQEQVMENSVIPLIDSVLQGYNASIFAYGQTGSGKTHTMIGPGGGLVDLPENCGIMPRACAYLFDSIDKLGNVKSTVLCSYLQIYNENIYDLFQKDGVQTRKPSQLEIKECFKAAKHRNEPNEIYVTGLSQFRINSASDLMRLLEIGHNNRVTRSTLSNDVSSRSHAILQLLIEIEEEGEGGHLSIRRSKLSFIDLAGSERMAALSDEIGDRREPSFSCTADSRGYSDESKTQVKELISINLSLTALGNVINILCQNSSKSIKQFVPYRDSKLTRLMQDSLGGNTQTLLIACISSQPSQVGESLRTLKFADCAGRVLHCVKTNIVIDDKVLLTRAQAEISRLKLLLANQKSDDCHDFGDNSNNIRLLIAENSRLKEENGVLRGLLASHGNEKTDCTSPMRHRREDDSSAAKKKKKIKLVELKKAYTEPKKTQLSPMIDRQAHAQMEARTVRLPKLNASESVEEDIRHLNEIRRKKLILQEELNSIRQAAEETNRRQEPLPSIASIQVSHLPQFTNRDIGMIGELYIFRYDHWQKIQIIDFDAGKKLHCCKYLDNDCNEESHWHNLKVHTFRPNIEL